MSEGSLIRLCFSDNTTYANLDIFIQDEMVPCMFVKNDFLQLLDKKTSPVFSHQIEPVAGRECRELRSSKLAESLTLPKEGDEDDSLQVQV